MKTEYSSLPRSYWAIVVISVVGWAGRFIFPFLTLYMTIQVGFDAQMTGLIMSLYGMGGLISVLASGILINKVGAKRLLMVSIIGTGLSAAGLAFVSDKVSVATLILLVGLFSTIMPPSVNTIISTNVNAALLRKAFSLQYVGINMGFAVAPIVSGMLVQISYTLLFVAEALLMTTSLLIVMMFIPKDDLRKIEYTATATNPIPVLKPGKKQNKLLKDKVFMGFMALNILFVVLYMQTQITLPLIMEEQGFSTVEYGLILTLNGLLVMGLQIPLDNLTKKFRISRLLILGMLLLALGFGIHAVSTTLVFYIVAVVIWSIAEIFNMPIATAATARIAPAGNLGLYQGLMATTFPAASFIGPIVGGLLLQSFGSQMFWIICVLIILVGALLRWILAAPLQERIDAAD